MFLFRRPVFFYRPTTKTFTQSDPNDLKIPSKSSEKNSTTSFRDQNRKTKLPFSTIKVKLTHYYQGSYNYMIPKGSYKRDQYIALTISVEFSIKCIDPLIINKILLLISKNYVLSIEFWWLAILFLLFLSIIVLWIRLYWSLCVGISKAKC